MRKGFLIVLMVALVAAIAAPAMAGTDINGFYRAKGYGSNFKTFSSGNHVNPSPADVAPTNSYVEQRLRLKFTTGEENVKAVLFLEQDMMWGDASAQVARNQGGAIQGDSINIETKNVYLWFKLPNTSADFTVGLQNVSDPYRGTFLGTADVAGVVSTFKFAPLSFRVGGFTPWERDTNQADDTQLFIVEAKIAPVKDLNVGLNFYFIRDGADVASSTTSGEMPTTANVDAMFVGGATAAAPAVSGVTKIYMPGVNFDYNAGVAKISGFAFVQFGNRTYDNTAIPKTKFGGYAADLRVDANAGPAKVFIEGLYTSGDKPGTSDKIEGVVVAEDFKMQSSSSNAYGMDLQILTTNGDDINTARGLIYSSNNNRVGAGYAMNGVRLGATLLAAGASMKVGDKVTTKVGAGYLRANQLAPAALTGTNLNVSKTMGTEVNANINYNIMKGLDFGLYGAYAWLGDAYKVSGSPTPDNLYDLHARVNYAF